MYLSNLWAQPSIKSRARKAETESQLAEMEDEVMELCDCCSSYVPRVSGQRTVNGAEGKHGDRPSWWVCDLCKNTMPTHVLESGTHKSEDEVYRMIARVGNEILIALGVEVQR